jgi:hypothetical protein
LSKERGGEFVDFLLSKSCEIFRKSGGVKNLKKSRSKSGIWQTLKSDFYGWPSTAIFSAIAYYLPRCVLQAARVTP